MITTIQNYILEVYRYRSKSNDINDLSGRLGRPDLTKFINEKIIACLPIERHSILVDVGCGDASLLIRTKELIEKFQGTLIGISPTIEEVTRLREHIKPKDIKILEGTISKINLPNDFADIVVCNSVLHGGGQTVESVHLALNEFNRILKTKGILYIGELSSQDELGPIKDHHFKKLLSLHGLSQFFYFCRKLFLKGFIFREPILVGRRYMYFSSPSNFIHNLSNHGFHVTRYEKHHEIDSLGNKIQSSRWNYVAIKLRIVS